ncbi:hypothetical protein PR202_gb24692 [Eleusine coracana subsp. coracana]|uniref:Uncharacterized protein n=1 Tax=Eleusine coracana subsp. coracana TaxID=191504 RepID=A0AAV5FJP2_ELECO|nr:hypothetical protein PR202_gb24692 [Eleusine coracana subsp. coracana]
MKEGSRIQSTHRAAHFLPRARHCFLASPHASPPPLGWSLAHTAACLLSCTRRRSLPSPRKLPLPGSLTRAGAAVGLLAPPPTC